MEQGRPALFFSNHIPAPLRHRLRAKNRHHPPMKPIPAKKIEASRTSKEPQVQAGKELKVTSASSSRILQWDDHLATAAKSNGPGAKETVRADRDVRF